MPLNIINNFRNEKLDVVSLMLELGANIDEVGWIQHEGNWFFGSPLELALHIKNEHPNPLCEIIVDVLSTAQEKFWKLKNASGNLKKLKLILHRFRIVPKVTVFCLASDT